MATDSAAPEGLPPLPDDTRIAAVVSTYHRELTGAMLASARAELESAGLDPERLVIVWAPGAFELPLIARRLAVRADIDAVLCFGLVLKGETSHDVYIAQAAAQGLMNVSLFVDKPVLFGVLTCDTLEQARARALPPAEGGQHDKGREVARAAVHAIAALEEAADLGRETSPVGFGAAGDREGEAG